MRYRSILSSVLLPVLLAGAVSCAKDAPVHPSPASIAGKVRLSVSAAGLPAVTKGGPDDAIGSIHAVVFDENGYLVEHTEAAGLLTGQGSLRDEMTFTLSLTATSEPRRIHLIANHAITSVPFGSETQLIGTMTTSAGETAYWQYVDLPDGIAEGESYPQLRRVPMVRNCASVQVVVNDANFTMKGFRVVNIPEEGSIAAWMTGTGPFGGYRSETAPTYAGLNAAIYHGYTPPGAALTSTPWVTTEQYVYEHPYTGDPTTYTYILLWGRLADMDADSYYKMDIVSKEGSTATYLDILRNFRYVLTVNALGSTGYPTPEEAASKPAGNNIAGSVDTESLDNISDGSGQFFVSATELVIVDDEPVVLKYKFIPDAIGAPTVTSNGAVTVEAHAGDVLASASTVATRDDADGWRTVTLHPHNPEGIAYSQTIRLITSTGLVKTVRLRLRPKFDFVVSCIPTVVERTIGEKVSVSVTLPDGLPESVFPLRVVFSSDGNTINPDPELNRLSVVVSGGEYGFLREISWGEYQEGKSFQAHFVTNARTSATTIRVKNHYFNTGSASFTNADRYVTSFTIKAYNLNVSGISTSFFRNYNTVYLYYDEARTSRVNTTGYQFYSYGLSSNTTVTVNRMKSTDRIYFYNNNTRTTASLTIEEIEEGSHTLAF